MTVVIQPNVVTPDGKAGVQTGELVLVTATGVEPLHGRRPMAAASPRAEDLTMRAVKSRRSSYVSCV
jgi:hypothetical protein